MTRSQEPMDSSTDKSVSVSRRGFLKGAGVTVAAVGLVGPEAAAARPLVRSAEDVTILGTDPIKMALNINGVDHEVKAEPWMTLLDVLRDRLDLTGSKRVCNRGSCGACTVVIDGMTVNSCSFLVADAVGRRITTIEGLANGEKLAPIQEAFVSCDATQCGFCTPGMIMSCHVLLSGNPKPTRQEIAEGISGNICRCGTYANIFEAVDQVAGRQGGGK